MENIGALKWVNLAIPISSSSLETFWVANTYTMESGECLSSEPPETVVIGTDTPYSKMTSPILFKLGRMLELICHFSVSINSLDTCLYPNLHGNSNWLESLVFSGQ